MVSCIELLKSCGISNSQITQFLLNFPRLFLSKPETMKEYINKVDEMGLSRNSRMFMHGVRVMSSMSKDSWESKLELFRSLGFTEKDILCVFRKSPQVFSPSQGKIKEVSDILISAADCDGKFPVSCAYLLTYSAKKRIIPRLKIMDTLESKKLLKRRPSVRTALKISNKDFFTKYVNPHIDVVGDLSVDAKSYYSTSAATTGVSSPPSSIADYLIKSHQLSPETASKASSSLTHLNLDDAGLIISYLKEFGFSTSHLDSLFKRSPSILSAKLDQTIKPKLVFLQELGISPPDIVELLSADPYILSRDITNQLAPSFLVLKSFLGSDVNVIKLLKASTAFLKFNLEKTMVPNIELLKSCGISQSQIIQVILSFQRMFSYKPETVKEYINKVDEMGLSRDSKMFVHGVRVLSSMSKENWESKLELFRELGFTEEDILCVFRKTPLAFSPSKEKIKEVSDILISAADCDGKFPVSYADLLMYSAKKRIIPRLKIIDTLEAKKLLKRRPSVRTALKLSNKDFFTKYVNPHFDVVGDLFVDAKSL